MKHYFKAKIHVRFLLQVIIGWSVCKAHRDCVYDKIESYLNNSLVHTNEQYIQHPFSHESLNGTRKLGNESAKEYSNIRIHMHYDEANINLTDAQSIFLRTKILPSAIDKISQALKVIPVDGNLFASRYCYKFWSGTNPPVCGLLLENQTCFDAVIPDDHFEDTKVCSSCYGNQCRYAPSQCRTLRGNGVPNADLVLYVQARATQYCSGDTLAYAAPCQQDQYDRPTHGYINFCPGRLDTRGGEIFDQVDIAIHEINHVLGLSSYLMPYFRFPDGTPRTPRDPETNQPYRGSYDCGNGKKVQYYTMPANNTVRFFNERGNAVSKLVTPRVLEVARKHFNCSTLNGVELENNHDSCIGSHWEERIFPDEIMSPTAGLFTFLSPLTLAYFEDSGWYQANYSVAENIFWGKNRGCEFATEKCIQDSKPIHEDHYCTDPNILQCSVDALSMAYCTKQTHLEKIPLPFRYFSNQNIGGDEFADYCPFWQSYAQGLCSNENNLVAPKGHEHLNLYGETYCPSCKCTLSSLHAKNALEWNISSKKAGCYKMTCDKDTNKIIISIPGVETNETISVSCNNEGEEISVPGYTGQIKCPNLSTICERDVIFVPSTPSSNFPGLETSSPTVVPTPYPSETGTNIINSTSSPTKTPVDPDDDKIPSVGYISTCGQDVLVIFCIALLSTLFLFL